MTSDNRWYKRLRIWVDNKPLLRIAYRIIVGIVGFLIMLIGLILVPLPGPGWAIVFVGLVILSTEFPAAGRVVDVVKRLWNRVVAWWRDRRSRDDSPRS